MTRWALMPGGHFRGPEFEGESMEVAPASEVERLREAVEYTLESNRIRANPDLAEDRLRAALAEKED